MKKRQFKKKSKRQEQLSEQKAEALRLRELKKLEALERSKQRMQDKEYFANKEKLNSEGKLGKNVSGNLGEDNVDKVDPVTVISELSQPETVVDDNPFRSKQRFKVAVK